MVTGEQVKEWIEQGMPESEVTVQGDGHHFDAVIVSEAFKGLNTLARHRLVYEALGDKMQQTIHALSMKTYTKDDVIKD